MSIAGVVNAEIKMPSLRDELLRRADRDQQARRRCAPLFAHSLNGTVERAMLGVEDQALVDELAAVDLENARWLTELVQQQGWPSRSQVGEEAAVAAGLLALHADEDLGQQRRCLDLMGAMAAEVPAASVAYLTDRVLLSEGQSQIYGTQVTVIDGKYQPRQLGNPETVDRRRAAIGISTSVEYEHLMSEES